MTEGGDPQLKVCGACGRTVEIPADLSVTGEHYCRRHGDQHQKVQMVAPEHLDDEYYLEILEKKYGESVNPANYQDGGGGENHRSEENLDVIAITEEYNQSVVAMMEDLEKENELSYKDKWELLKKRFKKSTDLWHHRASSRILTDLGESEGESSSMDRQSAGNPKGQKSDAKSGGEPPKPLDSKTGGDEDSDCSCIHDEDKAEPDAWRLWDKNKERVEQTGSTKDMAVMGTSASKGSPSLEPLYGVSTIRDTIEEVAEEAYCPGEMGGEEKGKSLAEKLVEVFGRRTDQEKEEGGDQ